MRNATILACALLLAATVAATSGCSGGNGDDAAESQQVKTPPPAQTPSPSTDQTIQIDGQSLNDSGQVETLPPQTPPKPASGAKGWEGYFVSGPHVRENLAIFFIHQKNAPKDKLDCLTLEEGLKLGTVKVHEKTEGAQVNALELENLGDRPVYVQAGDAVKGGKQDRTIAVDYVLPG